MGGRLLKISGSVKDILGDKPEDIEGKPLAGIVDKNTSIVVNFWLKKMQKMRTSSHPFTSRISLKDKLGHATTFTFYARVITSDSGEDVIFAVLEKGSKPIERYFMRKIQAGEHEARTQYEAWDIIVDKNLNINEISEEAQVMSTCQDVGKSLFGLIPEQPNFTKDILMEHVNAGKNYVCTIQANDLHGVPTFFELSLTASALVGNQKNCHIISLIELGTRGQSFE